MHETGILAPAYPLPYGQKRENQPTRRPHRRTTHEEEQKQESAHRFGERPHAVSRPQQGKKTLNEKGGAPFLDCVKPSKLCVYALSTLQNHRYGCD